MRRPVFAVRRGICRVVILAGPWAIKIPTTRPYGHRGGPTERIWAWTRGVQGNHSERQWSGVVGVAPVLWSLLGIVQCYPRCDPLPPGWHVGGEGGQAYRDIAPLIPFGDKKPENLGVLNGRVVWVDYDGSWNGCPHARAVAGLTDEDEG